MTKEEIIDRAKNDLSKLKTPDDIQAIVSLMLAVAYEAGYLDALKIFNTKTKKN